MRMYIQTQDLEIMKMAEEIADSIYGRVRDWDHFERHSIGIQLVKSVDSIGANIAESQGRHHLRDSIQFIYYSRASLEESKFWLRRANRRRLITQEYFDSFNDKLSVLGRQLNAFINAKKRRLNPNNPTIKPSSSRKAVNKTKLSSVDKEKSKQ